MPYDESYQLKECYPLFTKSHVDIKNKCFFKASPFINKKDPESIIVSLIIKRTEEEYDEDGYGGGIYEDYAFGVIDKNGCWAKPLSVSFSQIVNDLIRQGIDCKEYCLEENRKSLLW